MEENKWYFYQGGYLRTSSKEYNLEFVDDKFAHLTNDAIQHLDDDYGKYETWNKISFTDFEKISWKKLSLWIILQNNISKDKISLFEMHSSEQLIKLINQEK